MKTFAALILIHLSLATAFGQWQSLGNHYYQLQMIGNGNGYAFENTLGPTPATGTTYKIQTTLNDWSTELTADQGGGTDYGCCPIICMSFHNLSTGIRAKAFQGFCNFQKTTDYGQTWTNFSGNLTYYPKHLLMMNDTLAYMTRNYNSTLTDGRIYRLTPSAVTEVAAWDTMQFSNNGNFDFSDYGAKCNMEFINDSTGFVALFSDYYRAHIMRTADFGSSWNRVLTDYDYNFTGISFGDEVTGYASTMFGRIYKTSNGGFTWDSITSPTSSHINGIDFFDAQNGYIVCDFGEIYRTVDGGSSWISENSGITSNLISIQVVDNSCAYAISEWRELLKNENVLHLSSLENSISLYPNPASEIFNVSVKDGSIPEEITVYDHEGRMLLQSSSSTLSTSGLANGIYVISVRTPEKIYTSRFIKI